MYIITSVKKNIYATSGTNNDVDYHNKLFETDDCVITWQKDPTPEEMKAIHAQVNIDIATAKEKAKVDSEKEALIQAKIRDIAIVELKKEGKLDKDGNQVR